MSPNKIADLRALERVSSVEISDDELKALVTRQNQRVKPVDPKDIVESSAEHDQPEQSLLAYCSSAGIQRALHERQNPWSLMEEINIMLDIARNSDNENSRMMAISMLHRRRMEALKLEGRLATVSRTVTTDTSGNVTVSESRKTALTHENDSRTVATNMRLIEKVKRATMNPNDILPVVESNVSEQSAAAERAVASLPEPTREAPRKSLDDLTADKIMAGQDE